MTEPTPLRLVKTGAPEMDAEMVGLAEATAQTLMQHVKDGGRFWLLLDGDEYLATQSGNPLEMACLAEEVARQQKLELLGLYCE